MSVGEHTRTCKFVVTPAIVHNSYACPRKTKVGMENHTLDYILNNWKMHLGTTQKHLKLDFMRVRHRALRHRRSAQLNSVCAVAASLGLREQLLEDPYRFFRYGASHPSRKASTKSHCPQSLCTLLFLVHRLNVLPLK